jgi:hypothetical protein
VACIRVNVIAIRCKGQKVGKFNKGM